MTTDVGTFDISLDNSQAPKTVNNFVFLSRYHFYDGLNFHRVIPSFVVQGGDPTGTGSGGPGYHFGDELPKVSPYADVLPGRSVYKVGSVAMANSGPNTNGSQFFVIMGPQGTALPPRYSLFGAVTSGMDVLDRIQADGSSGGTPTALHKIEKVSIAEQ